MFKTVLKTISATFGIALGLLLVAIFFYDELPLGEPSAELLNYTGGPFLDMHLHTAGIGAGVSGCYVSEELANSYKFPIYLRAFGTSKDELIAQGDQTVLKIISQMITDSKYIDKAIVLALDGAVDEAGVLDLKQTQLYIPNEFLAEEIPKHENLLFGASINPLRTDALDRLDWAKKDGAVLVKWIPSIMLFDPADPKLIPFYRKLLELDLPLLTHTGHEGAFLGAKQEYADPLRLELALKQGVRIIAAHTAASGSSQGRPNQDILFELMKKYPNLYSDISALTQINRLGTLQSALAEEDLKERYLYGSDWPLQFQLLTSPWYHLRSLRLADIRYISKVKNDLDRDVLLKHALGVTDDIFEQSRIFFRQKTHEIPEANASEQLQPSTTS